MTAGGLPLTRQRPLAPLTTLRLGGAAAEFVEADTRGLIADALLHAQQRGSDARILGGGSNLVVADEGFAGVVVRIATRGIELERGTDEARVTVQAGESWDELVQLAIDEGLAGIECLSGIPGSVGATPIQNVGAYGQEVASVIEAVEVLDRFDGTTRWWSRDECAFGYRDSRFKREAERHVVLAVRFVLRTDARPTLRYAELTRAFSSTHAPTLAEVQLAVRALRANKGMLIDASYEPSAGSFFTNPVVTHEVFDEVRQRARAAGLADPPSYASEDRLKLSAAWLIENAGIRKGMRLGNVGVSSRHALALVHHGGGTTRELLALATQIRQQVAGVFGVQLEIEPVRW